MNSTSNSIMPLNTKIMTHDNTDRRLMIDEDDKNNNDKSKFLCSSGHSTRSNSPVVPSNNPPTIKVKSKKQLESSSKIDEKLSKIISGFSGESQLRRALEKGPLRDVPQIGSSTPIHSVSTSISLSSTPLLAASLSRPPVASPSSSLATLASAAVAASATSSTINVNSSAVDLSQKNSANSHLHKNGLNESIHYANEKDSLYEQLSTMKDNQKAPLRPPAEVYANLLMQLRHAQARINNGSRSLSPLAIVQQVQDHNIQESAPNSPTNVSSCNKLTAAARKEKLRLQTCFQCPVCKKRFQRHIALNAHFQNEHIGSTPSEKHCKLCTYVCPDITSIRAHLLNEHCIDLDSPSSCLVEGEVNPPDLCHGVKQVPVSCPPSPSSSSSPSQLPNGTETAETGNQSKRSARGKTKGRKPNTPSSSSFDDHKISKERAATKSPTQKERKLILLDTACFDDSSSSSTASNSSSYISSAVDAITSSSINHLTKSPTNSASIGYASDRYLSAPIKQEMAEETLANYNSIRDTCDEATDLSIKKSIPENPSSSSAKRKYPSSSILRTPLSDKNSMESDFRSLPLAKKLKIERSNPIDTKSSDNEIGESDAASDVVDDLVFQLKCQHCSIQFPNQTLYFLHRGFHSEGSNPWRCNGCGKCCTDMYDFNTHLMSDPHN